MEKTETAPQTWRVAGGWHAFDAKWRAIGYGRSEQEALEDLKVAVARAERLAAVAAAGVPVDRGEDLPA